MRFIKGLLACVIITALVLTCFVCVVFFVLPFAIVDDGGSMAWLLVTVVALFAIVFLIWVYVEHVDDFVRMLWSGYRRYDSRSYNKLFEDLINRHLKGK